MSKYDFKFFQGSTPSMELVLPLKIPQDAAVVVTVAQEGKCVLEYALGASARPAFAGTGQLEIDSEEEGVLILTMTQADTLKLEPGDIELQCRIRTEAGADTFDPLLGLVLCAHRREVL